MDMLVSKAHTISLALMCVINTTCRLKDRYRKKQVKELVCELNTAWL